MFGNMIERMLSVEESVEVQVALGLAFALFWGAFLESLVYVLVPWVMKQGWFQQLKDIMATCAKNWGCEQGDRTEYEWGYWCAKTHAYLCATSVQHAVGGIMAVPFVFGFETESYTGLKAYQWCMLAGLSEVGFEIWDIITRIYRQEDNFIMMVYLFMHHACALLIVIPCNLLFVTWSYAASIVNLQGVASLGLGVGCYARSCNLEIKSEAKSLANFCIVYCFFTFTNRGPFFLYFSYCLLCDLFAKEMYTVFCLAAIGGASMSFYNYLLIIDGFSTCKKYIDLAYASLAEDERKELVKQLTQENPLDGKTVSEEASKLAKQLTGTGVQLVKQLTGSGSSLVRQLTGGLKTTKLN